MGAKRPTRNLLKSGRIRCDAGCKVKWVKLLKLQPFAPPWHSLDHGLDLASGSKVLRGRVATLSVGTGEPGSQLSTLVSVVVTCSASHREWRSSADMVVAVRK
jgi:hypothetical protein